MESEKCPICGTSVKKENLRAHYAKVHPRRAATLVQHRVATPAKTTTVFRSHTRRNVLVLSLVMLATIGVSVAAVQFVSANTLRLHWHPHLTIILGTNQSVAVPAQIGIDQNLWKDHSLDQYGVGGLAPLHTHQTDGIIHVESNAVRDFTLQDFLNIWWGPSSSTLINGHPIGSITADGQPEASPQAVVLKDGQQIGIRLS